MDFAQVIKVMEYIDSFPTKNVDGYINCIHTIQWLIVYL